MVLFSQRRQWIATAVFAACTAIFSLAAGCGSGSGTAPATGASGSVFSGQTVTGESRAVGNGTVHSFVYTNAAGEVKSLGVVLSRAAMDNLPTTPTEFKVELPSAGGHGFQELGLDWNPAGHPPPGIYETPHFDVHFYLTTDAKRQQITGQGSDAQIATIAPPPSTVPTDYVMDVHSVVPLEGVHFEDLTAKEFNGQPFDATLIYGFYNGKMAFVEPMVTQAYLLQNTGTATFAAKQPAVYPSGVAFPGAYKVSYDAATGDTTISLENLTKH